MAGKYYFREILPLGLSPKSTQIIKPPEWGDLKKCN